MAIIINYMRWLLSISLVSFIFVIFMGCGKPVAIKYPGEEQPSNSIGQKIGASEMLFIEADSEIIDNTINRFAFNHFSNGTILESMGEYYLASQQYREALKYMPESAEIRSSYALSLFYLREFEKALVEAQKVNPRDLKTKILIADCYRVMGKTSEALAAYEEAVVEDSLNIQIWFHIARYHEQHQHFDSAAYAFSRVTDLNPSGGNFQRLGNLQIRAGLIPEALQSYRQSIELDSSAENVRAYLGLSIIYEETGDHAKARYYLEQAHERAPDDNLIATRLLGIYEDDGDYDKGIALARSIIERSPFDRPLVQRLGVMYYLQDSLQQADSVFTYLLNSGINDLSLQYYIGRVAFLRGDLPRAGDYFKSITLAADSIIDGWMNLGMVYHELDSLPAEIANYEKALPHLKTLDDSLVVSFSLAAAFEQSGQFDRAVELFEFILKYRPDHAPSLNYLGYMLVDKEIRLEYARELIEKALQISPDNGAYIDSYGWLLFRLGQYNRALEQLTLAYKYINDDPVVLHHLGDIYEALDEPDQARLYWRKALELDPDNEALKEKLDR